MSKETVEAIQAIGSTLTVLAAFGALAITVKGRSFDAKRAYSEFLLKQRLDSAGEVLGAFAAHFQNIGEATSARRVIKAGKMSTDGLEWAKRERERAPLAMAGSMQRINQALGMATPLFGDGLVPHVKGLFAAHRKANETGGDEFDYKESNKALAQLAIYFWKELNVKEAVDYQKNLFKP